MVDESFCQKSELAIVCEDLETTEGPSRGTGKVVQDKWRFEKDWPRPGRRSGHTNRLHAASGTSTCVPYSGFRVAVLRSRSAKWPFSSRKGHLRTTLEMATLTLKPLQKHNPSETFPVLEAPLIEKTLPIKRLLKTQFAQLILILEEARHSANAQIPAFAKCLFLFNPCRGGNTPGDSAASKKRSKRVQACPSKREGELPQSGCPTCPANVQKPLNLNQIS
jgi:hypothetical protein